MELAHRAVLVERHAEIMIITLNRPEANNAVNLETHLGVGHALEEADADPGVRAVIITSTGDRAFCAGADLRAIARGESIYPDDPKQLAWGFAGFVAHPISKPVIVAVNGYALGGGMEIALAGDLIVAAETAIFGLPEVTRGIAARGGGPFRTIRQLPRKIGMEMVLTGQPIDARRAYELGLVNRITSPATLMETALSLAQLITGNAPLAVQASKRIALGIDNGIIIEEEPFWKQTSREGDVVIRSLDAQEGARAFTEKRKPVWQAR